MATRKELPASKRDATGRTKKSRQHPKQERASKRTAVGVICVGNIFMGDDGIGPVIAAYLRAERLPLGIVVADIETGGLRLLHELAKCKKAVIVDAADYGGVPGETKCFSLNDVRTVKSLLSFTTHGFDMIKVLGLSESLGELPKETYIFAVQAGKVQPSNKLSWALSKKIPLIVGEVKRAAIRLAVGDTPIRARISR
jgi:hydrogenase maturation protease